MENLMNLLPQIITASVAISVAIIGWIFSYEMNIFSFKKQFVKEEYYKLKEIYLMINDLYIQFYDYVYEYLNNILNEKDNMRKYKTFEFSYKKMLKIKYIFNIISIEFPNININNEEYSNLSCELEKLFARLENIHDGPNKIENVASTITEINNVINELTVKSNIILSKINSSINNKLKTNKIEK